VRAGACVAAADRREEAIGGHELWFRLDAGFHRLCVEPLVDEEGLAGEAHWRAVTAAPLASLVSRP